VAICKSSHTITVQASTRHLTKVRNFVAGQAELFGFDEQQIADIRLAVDEAFTNIIKHAYENDEEQSVKIALSHNGDAFHISLFDTGKTFLPRDYEEPNVREKIRRKRRGGMGVYLIRKLMDEVCYRQNKTANEIRMMKER
jgi:serine/threonine-protein kinase RsbW